MSETIYDYSYYKGAYNSSGSLVSNAYLFEVEGILNGIDKSTHIASLTINWYITGKNGFSYSGFSGINTSIALRYNADSGSYTTEANGTMNSCTPTNTKKLMLSAKVECELNENEAYNIDYKNFYDGGESQNYLPRLHTQYGRITIPAQQFGEQMFVNHNGAIKQVERIYTNISGSIKDVSGIYHNDNGTIKKI